VNPKWHVLAHYTRHILPGTTFLATGDESVVAAHDPKQGRLTLVCLNDGDAEREWRIDLSRFGGKKPAANGWLTEPRGKSRHQPLEKLELEEATLHFRQPRRSVQTWVVTAADR
jgi:galactan endo-1,6-beta-galactosidase